MAESTTPLVWDFYRNVGVKAGIGGVVHFYESQAQSIYLNGCLATNTTIIEQGQWETADYSNEIRISDRPFELLGWDHPNNGALYGVAYSEEGGLTFLRYIYAMDISSLIESGTWSTQNDNSIAQISLAVKNVSNDTFNGEATLFQPGAKLTVRYQLGDSHMEQLGVAFVDDITYDPLAKTIPVSGRNKTGFFLNTVSLGSNTSFVGTVSQSIASILEAAGVDDYEVQPETDTKEFSFQPSTKALSAIQEICNYYSNWSGWHLVELPSGKIVVGRQDWINNHFLTTSFYQFDGAHEVFKRKKVKNADAAYCQIYVTGKGALGNDLTPVVHSVQRYSHWKLPAQKTYFATAPDGLSQSELQSYAELIAARMQFVGITETFSGPFRPYLLVGDVAQVYYAGDELATSLGTITGLTHSFGQKGFSTDFTVESGGEIMRDYPATVSLTKALGGYTRQQNILDFVRNIANGY